MQYDYHKCTNASLEKLVMDTQKFQIVVSYYKLI